MAADPWHFPRREFTARVLKLLRDGPGQALTLFGPRRTGKTEFLLKDIAPLAEQRGHRVIYASFWQAPLSPLAVLLHAMETSLRRGTFGDRVRRSVSGLTPTLKLSAFGAGVEAKVDLTALGGRPPDDLLVHLDDLLERVSGGSKATILLLDEVQGLPGAGATRRWSQRCEPASTGAAIDSERSSPDRVATASPRCSRRGGRRSSISRRRSICRRWERRSSIT